MSYTAWVGKFYFLARCIGKLPVPPQAPCIASTHTFIFGLQIVFDQRDVDLHVMPTLTMAAKCVHIGIVSCGALQGIYAFA